MKYRGVRVASPKTKLRNVLADVAEYEGIYMRATYLLRKLITIHIFEDGNKPTAWTVTLIYLERHGLQPAEQGLPVERVLRRIRRFDVDEIARWLETGELDRDRLHP